MTQTVIQRNVTQVLRTLLLAYGERQEDVAAALGVTQAAVSNKMAGKTRWSIEDLAILAEHFGVDGPGRFLDDPRSLFAGVMGGPLSSSEGNYDFDFHDSAAA